MFNSPGWAALIDVKMADGVVQAVSAPRLAPYGLVTTPLVTGAGSAPAGASGPPSSPPSLATGLANVSNQVEAVARHGRNIALCEAFYPALHMLEVVMRNSIHNAFRHHFAAPDWYDQGWLTSGHLKLVNEAKAELTKRSKPVTPDRVVAELSFGFWCGMFSGAYETHQGAWPTLLKSVLPRVPKSWRTRPKIKQRVEAARDIRNRIFHHEPITQYADLRDRHRKLVELLGWFSPEARQHVEHLCRFSSVFGDQLVLAPPAPAPAAPATVSPQSPQLPTATP